MEMIVGGAYQGKFRYGKTLFPETCWADGAACGEEELYCCDGIRNFHLYVKRGMEEGWDLSGLTRRLIKENPDLILITDELGCGIVPADPFLREYRERTGRLCTELAVFSQKVHRVVCGVGMVIKG